MVCFRSGGLVLARIYNVPMKDTVYQFTFFVLGT